MFSSIFHRGLRASLLPALMLLMLSASLRAEDTSPKKEIGFDEKLGETMPLELKFLDEHGGTVTLKELIDRPVIFCLVYYRCPGLCSPLLKGVADVIDRMDLEAGKDFKVITIGFDPKETYITASEKKNNYLESMKKQIPDDSWRFLVGDSVNTARITDAVGFRYIPQGNDFMHAAAIMTISPQGKIARYLYGTEFQPLDVKLALIEASEGKTGPTISKLMKLCYSYDPEGKKYVLNLTRIAGGGVLFFLGIFVAVLVIRKKKNIQPKDAERKQ